VFDLWVPEDASPETPPAVFVYFHGGGFVAGDKSKFDPTPYLNQGYAAMSGNYRFVNGDDILTPVPMQDCTRALQYLRHRSGEFGIDPKRIAVSGGSAGAVITMWIAYKDDMANPPRAFLLLTYWLSQA
jgi:acetyl esterase/lipase